MQFSTFLISGCIREENIDYRAGPSNNILDREGLTPQGCADMAASTEGGHFWTFKAQVQAECSLVFSLV